jgi:cell division protein FtsQ
MLGGVRIKPDQGECIMKKRAKTTPKSSWRNIQQKNRRSKKTTKVARDRHLKMLLKWSFICLAAISTAAGIAYIYLQLQSERPEAVPMVAETVKLNFDSDGVLTANWFKESYPTILRTDVREIDVSRLKDNLENRGQVSAATVAVSLPSSLIVQLEEKEPILRVRIRDSRGNPLTLLVARDGTIYKGALYPPETLRNLPGVMGLRIKQDGNGYLPIAGLDDVALLLDVAKEQIPAVYRHWRVVDLTDWNPDETYRPSLVKIQSSNIEEIVFSTTGIEAQIEQLSGILQHVQRYQMALPKSIDLSYGDKAVIR